MIKEFYMKGLHGERNVRITFNSSYKIIVAENGYGKTSILNAFYALMSGNISKLRKIVFTSIGVIFDDKSEISFDKKEFDQNINDLIKNSPIVSHLEVRLGRQDLIDFINKTSMLSLEEIENSSYFNEVRKKTKVPNSILKSFIHEIRNSEHIKINKKTSVKLKNIHDHFPFTILYLPTYRRVEEDIRTFYTGSEDLSLENFSINFGMSDVKKSINNITSEILTSSSIWFSKINGQMLAQLVTGFVITEEMKKSISQPKSVEIVLERIGDNISTSHKEQILELVTSGAIFNGYNPLLYFVSNLLKVYEQQQENDKSIQNFTTVSNKYLRDKEVIYDESNVTINIVRKKNRQPVDIDTLSSGEKQIISLFAMLYLQKREEIAIFFDEPELSLSMEWQKTLLPDILDSGKCKFLFATTHSPFIFENELEAHTVDLAEYIEEL
ncbi:AAA family ATPase [Acinetobacter sp. SA01]|uniref:AAA family ATPase n=1 Tax=Acinetobacter sp. SA01 TaxID=1862567 RepID=UPI00140A5B0B